LQKRRQQQPQWELFAPVLKLTTGNHQLERVRVEQ